MPDKELARCAIDILLPAIPLAESVFQLSAALPLTAYLSETIPAGPPEISDCLTWYASAMSNLQRDIRRRESAVNRRTHPEICTSGHVRFN